jgi:hypothetical protein
LVVWLVPLIRRGGVDGGITGFCQGGTLVDSEKEGFPYLKGELAFPFSVN